MPTSQNLTFMQSYIFHLSILVLEFPPEPAAKFQGGSELAKTRILRQVVNRDKTPQMSSLVIIRLLQNQLL